MQVMVGDRAANVRIDQRSTMTADNITRPAPKMKGKYQDAGKNGSLQNYSNQIKTIISTSRATGTAGVAKGRVGAHSSLSKTGETNQYNPEGISYFDQVHDSMAEVTTVAKYSQEGSIPERSYHKRNSTEYVDMNDKRSQVGVPTGQIRNQMIIDDMVEHIFTRNKLD